MSHLISLDYFEATSRHFHIYKLKNSDVAEQMHHHDYFQVCFVSCGEILHEQLGQTDRSVRLCHGDAFIIPPYFSHRIKFMGGRSEIYSLSFSDTLFHPGFFLSNIAPFLDHLQTHTAPTNEEIIRLKIKLDKNQRANIQALFECLLREQNGADHLSPAASLIAASLYTLAQGYYQQPENRDDYNEIAVYNSSLAQCIEYIDQHYKENINLSDLAKQFAMSRSSFSSLFPRFTGLSLKQYIRRKRVLEAESIIRDCPNLTMSEISLMVGYEDPSTFYRNFLQISGVSPSEYRKLIFGE